MAQKRRPNPARQPQSKQTVQAEAELAKAKEEFIKLSKEYKASLDQLLAFRERDVKNATEQLEKEKKLFDEGLVSKRELENRQQAVTTAQAKVEEVKQQLRTADARIAEVLVESTVETQVASARPAARGSSVTTGSYIRYTGMRAWSLSEAPAVEGFFASRFGRALPISTFGQSALHDRWGLDHHNAMDVSVNPDSAEGKALMDYLRSNGIPFLAFRVAIPGVATGPHIHIGRPSRRIARSQGGQ